MRYNTVFVFLFSVVLSALNVSDKVASTNEWVEEVTNMMNEHDLVTRFIDYTHATIPGIGMPSNHITGYFHQYYVEEDGEPYLEEIPLLIVNKYTHAGYGAEECYYFTMNGEMVCCVSTLYGDGFDRDDYTDCFYYSSGEVIYHSDNTGEATDVIDSETAAMAISRIHASVSLTGFFYGWNVPAPCIFCERWGDWMITY